MAADKTEVNIATATASLQAAKLVAEETERRLIETAQAASAPLEENANAMDQPDVDTDTDTDFDDADLQGWQATQDHVGEHAITQFLLCCQIRKLPISEEAYAAMRKLFRDNNMKPLF